MSAKYGYFFLTYNSRHGKKLFMNMYKRDELSALYTEKQMAGWVLYNTYLRQSKFRVENIIISF